MFTLFPSVNVMVNYVTSSGKSTSAWVTMSWAVLNRVVHVHMSHLLVLFLFAITVDISWYLLKVKVMVHWRYEVKHWQYIIMNLAVLENMRPRVGCWESEMAKVSWMFFKLVLQCRSTSLQTSNSFKLCLKWNFCRASISTWIQWIESLPFNQSSQGVYFLVHYQVFQLLDCHKILNVDISTTVKRLVRHTEHTSLYQSFGV